jgi:hypothetical protein
MFIFDKNKAMKHAVLSLFTMWLSLSCSPKQLPTVFENTDTEIAVKLSHMTTQTEMTAIRDSLSKKSITFDFAGSEFFDDNHLRILKLKVIMANGAGGQTTADLMSLQHNYIGFRYREAGAPAFAIGKLEK